MSKGRTESVAKYDTLGWLEALRDQVLHRLDAATERGDLNYHDEMLFYGGNEG